MCLRGSMQPVLLFYESDEFAAEYDLVRMSYCLPCESWRVCRVVTPCRACYVQSPGSVKSSYLAAFREANAAAGAGDAEGKPAPACVVLPPFAPPPPSGAASTCSSDSPLLDLDLLPSSEDEAEYAASKRSEDAPLIDFGRPKLAGASTQPVVVESKPAQPLTHSTLHSLLQSTKQPQSRQDVVVSGPRTVPVTGGSSSSSFMVPVTVRPESPVAPRPTNPVMKRYANRALLYCSSPSCFVCRCGTDGTFLVRVQALLMGTPSPQGQVHNHRRIPTPASAFATLTGSLWWCW